MKTFLIATASVMALCGLSSANAADISVSTVVPQMCRITNSGSAITVSTHLSNGDNLGSIQSTESNATKIHVFCNVPTSKLSVTRKEMELQGNVSPFVGSQFTKILTFEADVTGPWAGAPGGGIWSTDNDDNRTYSYGAYESDLMVKVRGVKGLEGKKPLAGTYNGYVTVAMTPNM